MNTRRLTVVLALFLVAGMASADVFKDLAKYEYGASPNVAEEAFKQLNDVPVAQHAAIEAKLIAVVSNKDATQAGKAFACRMLRQIGSEQCIPAVSELLGDEILSDYARLVLERMTGSAKAAEALRVGLEKAPDKAKVGILASLGEIRDGGAVKQIARLAGSSDAAVAVSAMMALGKIGSPEAADGLVELNVAEGQKPQYLDALTACARRLGGSGAASLYRRVITGKSAAHCVAAMQGLAAVDAKAGAAMIIDALKADELTMRQGALGAIVTVKGAELTKAVTASIDGLPPDRKPELITALGSRGDKAALEAVSRQVKSENAAVRDAAIAALGRLGDAGTVPLLLGVAASADVRDQVKTALTRLEDAGADAALLEALSKSESRATVIQVLAARNCTTAAPRLLELLKDENPDVRKEAWSGLGALAGAGDMAAVMKAVVKVTDDRELRYARDTVKKIYAGASDASGCFTEIAGVYAAAPAPIKALLLELGAVAGTAEALELERKALQGADVDLRKAAIRALASWPNTAAADDLYALATSATEESDRILGLRGYIGLAGSDQVNMSGSDRMKMFSRAEGLVKRPDEKRLIVSGLPRVGTTEAFGMLAKYMDEAEVKREAEMAAANLLWETRNRKSPASEAIARRLLASEDKGVRDRVGSVVSEWSKFKSYITSWLMTGPFNEQGKGGSDVFKKAFPPETNPASVKWVRLEKGIDREAINLEAHFGGIDNCCVYVKTAIDSPADQPARLELGSDDGVKAWLNGKLVHEHWVSRGCSPGQDTVNVTLKKGHNDLMLKIVDEKAQWAFSCRLRDGSGMPIEGLKVSAE